MKVLIADDERLVCFSLESMLNELGIHSKNIVKCFNGEDFLKNLSVHLPDIAFVDIKMPKVNGIDAIERGKAISPKTRYYILTSFPEFDYAKRAIDIGVSGYLLKPLSLEELKEVLKTFKVEKRESYKRDNAYFENVINALFNNVISVGDKEVRNIENLSFMGVIVTIDSASSEKKRAEYQVAFFNKLRKEFESFVGVGVYYAFSTLDNGYPVIVFGWNSLKIEDNLGEDISGYIKRKLERVGKEEEDSVFTFIVTEGSFSYEELVEALKYLKDKGYMRCVLGIGKCVTEEDIREILSIGKLDILARRADELVSAYNGKHYLDFLKAVDGLESSLLSLSLSETGVLNSLCRFFKLNLGLGIIDCEEEQFEVAKLIKALKETSTALIEKQIEEKTDSMAVVEEVKSFIEKNYMNNIGIAQIAYRLNLTPNYLSALFHRKTGKTFINYLTDIRIEKAKEFLTDPSLKVCDVARRVGYYSTRYFSRVFKKRVGFQPSEYVKFLAKK